jgi:lactate dehydrogenase-like 2-hydroxyacid dehydrogenase
MRVAFFEIKNWEKSYFKKKLKGHVLKLFAVTLNLENVNEIKDFDAVSVFVYSKVDAQIIAALPNLTGGDKVHGIRPYRLRSVQRKENYR